MWKIGLSSVGVATGIGYWWSQRNDEEPFVTSDVAVSTPQLPTQVLTQKHDIDVSSTALIKRENTLAKEDRLGNESHTRNSPPTNDDQSRHMLVPVNPGKYGLPGEGNVYRHHATIASVNYQTRTPNWVLQHNTREYLKVRTGDRQNSRFTEDKQVPKPFRATLSDYRDSGYSRGHLAPAGDNKFNQVCMDETFLLSTNIIPQDLSMNGCDWLRLERMTHKLSKRYSDVYVVSGPAYVPQFDHDEKKMMMKYEVIGRHQVAVPTHVFKVIVAENEDGKDRVFGAFLMENKPIKDQKPLYSYQVPLSELEKLTGLEFFPKIDRSSLINDVCVSTGCVYDADKLIRQWRNFGIIKDADSIEELNNAWDRSKEAGFYASWEHNMYKQEYERRMKHLKSHQM
eukprot:m.2727 g.2727  ORF g.2727 m.2727 type:complete len:398 (+) comp1910_c0_seq2:105-1298(+)